MARISRFGLSVSIVATIASACGGASATPTPGATSAPTASPTAAPSIVATVPVDQLRFAGKLEICVDIPYPPQEMFDANGNPIGSDVEIGQGIATRLGLQPEVINSVFDTIITALTGGKCDVIVSAQNINPDRLGQVDMIPYFQAGQAFLVQVGNPENLQVVTDLCGKKVAAESGTTEMDNLSGTGDYAGAGLPATCAAAGKPAPVPQPFTKDPDALAALQAGTADAYFADLPPVIAYANGSSDKFMLAPIPQLEPAVEGISVVKSSDPAKAHTELYDAVKTALLSMMSDGSYSAILTKYGDQSGAITPDVVNTPQVAPSPSAS